MRLSVAFLPTLLVAVAGCGGSDEAPTDPGGDPLDPSASWPTLIAADWSVPAGMEDYVCARQTMTEDVFVAGFAGTDQPGAHHALLTLGVPDAPDGVAPCDFNTTFAVTTFAADAGTKPLEFPPGIATKIPKGTQLLLNVHLVNSTEAALSGSYGVRINTITESEVVDRTEYFAAGTQRVTIPPRGTTTSTGYCKLTNEFTLVAVAPHMHALGRHEKVVAETASGEITLFDGPYTFGQQAFTSLDPVKMATGDRLRVECTHENTTEAPVTNGPTLQNEMCMASFFRYPVGGLAFCMDN